jgi:hypothetical protein
VVKLYIEKRDIDPIKQKSSHLENLERQVEEARDRLLSAFGAWKNLHPTSQKYVLEQTHAPRYWEPNDPVVMITGDLARPTRRHGVGGELYQNGLLTCCVVSGDELGFDSKEKLDAICNAIRLSGNTFGKQVWERQPWNPIMLEWEVEFFPAAAGNNLDPGYPFYDTAFILNNYQLPINAPDFREKPGWKGVERGANVYNGRTILTPHAKNQLKLRLEEYLKHADTEEASPDFRNLAKQAYNLLQTTNVLAQALGGFNQALLMRKQTYQLPAAEPIGFENYKRFSANTSIHLGSNNFNAPLPLNDFNPIRAGEMKLLRLRLIDTFGQVWDIDCEKKKIIASQTLLPQSRTANPVRLPPKLTQPARLNFRWLAAEARLSGKDETEMNDHPATSPVCGWILPNYLNGSFMIYEQRGRALGSLDQNGKWHSAPGEPRISLRDIPNLHLRKLVNYLVMQNKNDLENEAEVRFLENFSVILEKALENIEPENLELNDTLALLIGRPVAVVRATLNLELRGLPAIHQGWNVFRQDLARHTRATTGFTGVKFPIRIGEFEQLNDGLVGYWVENADSSLKDNFYTTQTMDEGSKHHNIRDHQAGDPAIIYQSIDDPLHKLTMLLDPRGVVQATCGILPAKAIRIPPEHVSLALHNLEVTFLTAPILTDVVIGSSSSTEVGQVNLPLPEVEGYEWSWLEKENGAWTSSFKIAPISQQAAFAAKQELREGWLKLKKTPPTHNRQQ